MSNHLGLATVTAVLRARVDALFDAHGMGAFDTFAGMPGEGASPGVYLHLFRIVPNAAYRMDDLPTRRADGTLAARPSLALDLHYLIVFVGAANNTTFDAERLAGLVVRDLHSRPSLSTEEIDAYMGSLGGGHVLAESDLGADDMRVRLSPLPADLEDMSRLWGMLGQSYHALSVAWLAQVVRLDAEADPEPALPVAQARVAAFQSQTPTLTAAVSSARNQPIVQLIEATNPPVESLVLRGSALMGSVTRVRLGGLTLTPTADQVRTDQIVLPLDDASGLPAGVMPVQVVHEVDVDGGGNLRTVGVSNSVAIALAPTVTDTVQAAPSVGDPQVTLVDVPLAPIPGPDQAVVLLLDDTAGGGQVRSEDWSEVELAGVMHVRFRVLGAIAGTSVVRVTVDGATTLLTPGAGGFDPRVSL